MAFESRTQDETFDDLASEVVANEGNANPRNESTLVYALLFAVAATHADREDRIQSIYDAAYVEDASGDDLTKKARNLGVVRQAAVRATGVVTFSRDSTASQDYTIPSGTVVETVEEDPIQFETTESVTLTSGTSSVDATIRAIDGGSQGNVGANTIESMPSPPTGVDSVTNSNPTGDPSLTDTDGDALRRGRDRENDAELRERVFDTDTSTKGPTAGGIELALLETENVESAVANVNATSSTSNGLDPYTTEVVVLGGADSAIVETLRDTMSVTTLLRLQGGVNGTKVTNDVTVSLLEQTVTVPFSRPTEVTFDLDIDVVHTDEYVGDDTVKDTIVEYVGGTLLDDTTTFGRLIGENVLVNRIENDVEDLEGVVYADVTLIDTNSDGSDDTTTDSDGVPVLSIADSEVARLDADDVTVSTTAR